MVRNVSCRQALGELGLKPSILLCIFNEICEENEPLALPATDATAYGEIPHSNLSLFIKQEAANQSLAASCRSCPLSHWIDTTVDNVIKTKGVKQNDTEVS